MNGFMKRAERVKVLMLGHEENKVTLVYADGVQRTLSVLEAVNEISQREDVVDVLTQHDTIRSLLLAMLGPWDFSGLEELAGQMGGE